MPNGRNAVRIFGRNADGGMPTATAQFRAECRKQEGAEMKACPWQKYQVLLIVFENVYTSGKFWGIYFASIAKPRT